MNLSNTIQTNETDNNINKVNVVFEQKKNYINRILVLWQCNPPLGHQENDQLYNF